MTEGEGVTEFVPLAKVSDKRGLALFEETIDEIEAHGRNSWNQGVWLGRVVDGEVWEEDPLLADFRADVQESKVPAWDCGTVACLFGHVVFKAGSKLLVWTERWDDAVSAYVPDLDRAVVSTSYVVDPEGKPADIRLYAAELLELPDHLAHYISGAQRSWEQIIEFRDAWREDVASGPTVMDARERIVSEYYADSYFDDYL